MVMDKYYDQGHVLRGNRDTPAKNYFSVSHTVTTMQRAAGAVFFI